MKFTPSLLIASLLSCSLSSPAQAQNYLADFDQFWATIQRGYAYFHHHDPDWLCVRQHYRPRAAEATTGAEFQAVMEQAIEELHDAHAHLNRNTARSYRLTPSGSDVWAQWEGDAARIVAVRAGAKAWLAGLRVGDLITHSGPQPLRAQALTRLGPCSQSHAATLDWALQSVLAGQHGQPRVWTVQSPLGAAREVRPDEAQAAALPAVEHQWLGDGLGLIAVRDLGSTNTVASFDQALLALRHARGLILDLSDTAAGGNTDVAEPIMGRFISSTQGYQRILPLRAAPWVRQVHARGPWRYDKPLLVLVSRWTGSMGEGMAIGLDGMGRATVVGSAMAGLRGAVFSTSLPISGISFTYPAEALAHVDGRPREKYLPAQLLDAHDGAALRSAGQAALLRLLGPTR